MITKMATAAKRNELLNNSHIISNSNTLSTIFGMRDQLLELFCNLRSRTRSKIMVCHFFLANLVLFLNINERPINYKFKK